MVVIGVHTPETAAEAKVENVRQKVKENKMTYPIAIDNRLGTWKAWNNRCWPTTYLIDKAGNVRYYWEGELKWKDANGEDLMRKGIEELLAEKEKKGSKPK